jgi:hypothetical protein
MEVNEMSGACSTHGRDHFEDLGEDERIIIEWILEKLSGKLWIGFIWLRG